MKLIALDIETTDVIPKEGEIIEFAAVKYEDGKIIDEYKQLFKTRDGKIPFIITSITGITEEDIKGEILFEEKREEIEKFIGDLPIVGHNIGFDVSFLRENGIPLTDNKLIDTFRLATILLPGFHSYSLESLSAQLEIAHVEKHRALDDAKAGLELFLLLQEEVKKLHPDVLKQIQILVKDSDWDMADVFTQVASGKSQVASRGAIHRAQKKPVPSEIEDISDFKSSEIAKLFKEGSATSKVIPNYEYRKGQVKAVQLISESLDQDKLTVIEAGAGIGKSMAYLIPSIYLAKSKKEQVIVSTGTKNLQDQLVQKDIPQAEAIMPFNFKWAILKGRRNYICLRKFEEFKSRGNFTADEIGFIVKLTIWLSATETGDLEKLPLTWEEKALQYKVASDNFTCSSSDCPNYDQCFLYNNRKKAKDADIVIVNHSLLLSDPKVENLDVLHGERLIIDEAHKLEDAATDAFGFELRLSAMERVVKKVYNKSKNEGIAAKLRQNKANAIRGLATRLLGKVPLAFALLAMFARDAGDLGGDRYFRLVLDKTSKDNQQFVRAAEAFNEVKRSFEGLAGLCNRVAGETGSEAKKKQLDAISDQLKEYSEAIERVLFEDGEDFVRWIESIRDEEVIAKLAPIHVGDELNEGLYKNKQSIVMMSATIGTFKGEDFEHFKNRLALQDFSFHRVESEFDYKNQSLFILPKDLAHPNNQKHSDEVAEVVIKVAKALSGRTMVLFTSHASIRTVYKKVFSSLKETGIHVFAQGVSGGRGKILEGFKHSKAAVLMGTDSFWEGVDVIGKDLEAVIIAKLPFSVPSEPVFAARNEEYEDGFNEYALPLAILKFRQGFGRLIRSKKDRGVVIMMDSRVQDSKYGLKFLESLPETSVGYENRKDIAKASKEFVGR